MKYRNIDRNVRSTVTVATWFGNLVPVRVLSERGNSYTDNTVVGFTVLETLPQYCRCTSFPVLTVHVLGLGFRTGCGRI